MLSTERCRQLLGAASSKHTDAEILQLREAIYAAAQITVRTFCERFPDGEAITTSRLAPQHSFMSAVRDMSDAEREAIEERAAIHEFDGGLPRHLAERFALRDHGRR